VFSTLRAIQEHFSGALPQPHSLFWLDPKKEAKKIKAKQCFLPPCCTLSILARSWTSLFGQMLAGAAFPASTRLAVLPSLPANRENRMQGIFGYFEESRCGWELRGAQRSYRAPQATLRPVGIRKWLAAVTFLWSPFFGWEPKKGDAAAKTLCTTSG